ncbi:MAG: hypothetical protein QOG01_383 [Pseudonocardiales bacterium]|jgi:hypothetical protein|nr:hypothetical protein [Pseudonocardiales bacterium]
MTWTAPEADRSPVPYDPAERALLDRFLDVQRATLLAKCAGLTAEQLKLRSGAPSTLSLLGLVRHLAGVERWWFRTNFRGEDVGWLFGTGEDDDEFDKVDEADAEADFATYAVEVAAARAAVEGHGLDETFHNADRQADLSLRWVYLHVIEEYARHNGHADILRERIDGATGW